MTQAAVRRPGRRRTAWVLAALYLGALAAVVFSPIQWWLNRLTVKIYVIVVYDLHGPTWLRPEHVGALLNVVLFVPFGVLLVWLVRTRWWVATALAVATSCGIELLQALPQLQRQPSLTDVVTNGLGALLGGVLARAVDARASARARGGA